MSLFHQTEEDDAFALAHADAGLRAAHRRVNELRAMIRECAPFLPANSELSARVAREMLEPDAWLT